MPVVEANGAELFYETVGAGEPVVLLNGIMMTTQSWALQTAPLAERYRCILHDFRGQLRSPAPGPIRMEQHVEDLAALLDDLEVDSAHLVGTSYGAEVGLLFALAYPERVQSLALVAAVSHVEPLLHRQVRLWADTARDAPERLYEVSAPHNFSNRFLAEHPEAVERGRARLAEHPPAFFHAFAELCEAFLELNVRDRLVEIAAPTLVLCGEEDALKPVSYSRIIARQIAGTEFIVIPEAGHAVVIERADTVNTALLGFLSKHASTP